MKRVVWSSRDLKLPKWLKEGAETAPFQALDAGWSYYSGACGTPVDYELAYLWFLQASQKGCSEADYHIGGMHYHGFYVQDSTPEAVKWFELSAAKGNSDALEFLFEIHLNGEFDLKIDIDYARKIAQGEKRLGLKIYYLHFGDLFGQSGDYINARRWYQRAFHQGYPDGALKIYRLYRSGLAAKEGCGQYHGNEWLKKAANCGDTEARSILRENFKLLAGGSIRG